MNQKAKIIQFICINGIVLLALVSLSGCATNQNENQNTNDNINAFLGTWIGTLQMPMFGAGSNVSVSQITFTNNRTEMILTSQNRTFTLNYTYSATRDTLVLTPLITERNRFAEREPFNGTIPPNATQPPGTWTIPPNGTQPPGNGIWPPNGTTPFNGTDPSNWTRPPGNNPSSMTVTFLYAFDEESRVLYLNNEQFIKVQ